jgi:hypothetical protein
MHCLTEEYIMYTVSIQWGDTAHVHTAWTLSSAKSWLAQYPNKDVFGTVTDYFGRTVAVKYCR